jgi:DNA processing protein
LSYGVVVVEAGLNSGSLITAGFALNQGREVFAVPGNINNTFSKGTNKLIQDGATPIVEIDEILEMLGIHNLKIKKTDEINLGDDERLIINMIKDKGSLSIDGLCMLTGKPPSIVSALVTVMEIKGLVLVSMGKIHVAK